jgi:hypothetical protein
MLSGLSSACIGTGTSPRASAAWSMAIWDIPFGTRIATRSPLAKFSRASAARHLRTSSPTACQE